MIRNVLCWGDELMCCMNANSRTVSPYTHTFQYSHKDTHSRLKGFMSSNEKMEYLNKQSRSFLKTYISKYSLHT